MNTVDGLVWMMGGLVAGILIGAVWARGNPGKRIAVAAVGLVGGFAGGVAVAGSTDLSAVTFLGAVFAAVVSSGSLAYLLWRPGAMRYHS